MISLISQISENSNIFAIIIIFGIILKDIQLFLYGIFHNFVWHNGSRVGYQKR